MLEYAIYIGIAVSLFGGYKLLIAYLAQKNATVVSGTIVEVKDRRSKNHSRYYYPEVTITSPDGVERQVRCYTAKTRHKDLYFVGNSFPLYEFSTDYGYRYESIKGYFISRINIFLLGIFIMLFYFFPR